MPLIGVGITPRACSAKPGGAWLPTDVAGCVEWYRADSVTLNGADVSAWQNLGTTGATRDLAQATPANQPLYNASGGPNNMPYVEFDGSTEYLAGAWTQGQPTHTFGVMLISITDTVPACILDGVTNASRKIYISGHGVTNATAGAAMGVVVSADAWARVEIIWNGTSSQMRVNDTSSAIGNLGTGTPNGIVLGCDGNIANHADGYVAEWFGYDSVLGTTDRARAHAYLTDRYGI